MSQPQTDKVASSQEIQQTLREIQQEMLEYEEKGNYVQADALRQKAALQRKQWEELTLTEMGRRHAEESDTLEKEYENLLEQCDEQWTNNMEQFADSRQKQMNESDSKNKHEIEELKKIMNQQFPKLKESHELLNLREMQYHMSKQKDFAQAHLIQQRIKELHSAELKAWKEGKAAKIEQAVAKLKAKHSAQRQLFTKRNQIEVEDDNNRWRHQRLSIQQRFNNTFHDMKARQERQLLSFKRSFKTKGGFFSEQFQSRSTE